MCENTLSLKGYLTYGNSLPAHVVNSSSVDSFKNNLDKFWIVKKSTIILNVI